MNFPLEKCLCLVMSSVTGASAVTGISHPHPPGILSIAALLFPVPHPELTNICHPSCEHLHKFPIRAGTDPTGCCIHVTGEGNWCEVQCADHRSCPELFFEQRRYLQNPLKYFGCTTLDIYLREAGLRQLFANQNHIL